MLPQSPLRPTKPSVLHFRIPNFAKLPWTCRWTTTSHEPKWNQTLVGSLVKSPFTLRSSDLVVNFPERNTCSSPEKCNFHALSHIIVKDLRYQKMFDLGQKNVEWYVAKTCAAPCISKLEQTLENMHNESYSVNFVNPKIHNLNEMF